MGKIRVISGIAKGRYLKSLPEHDLSIRPILARIKKSLFDILQNRVKGSKFLDLFAGTGAVGIEALSRGAELAVFVENDARSLANIKENLKQFHLLDISKVVKANAVSGLNGVGGQFDLIFMGPPYKDANSVMLSLTGPTLRAIVGAKLLKADGWIIAQHHETEKIEFPPELDCFRHKEYGDTIVSFYQLRK